MAAFKPLFFRDWVLESILSVLLVFILIFTYNKFKFSNLSYGLITIHLILHTIGSHYTYAEVPFGFWLQNYFNLTRNHYDRIVHFAFGLLMTYPIKELISRKTKLNLFWSYFFSFSVICMFSLSYELLEIITAYIVAPDLGLAYLGTQGDLLDGQKDSLLALGGSLISLFAIFLRNKLKWGSKIN